jgi:hypothetical protein
MASSYSGSDFDGLEPEDLIVDANDGSDISIDEASSGDSSSLESEDEQVPDRWTEHLLPRPKHAFSGPQPGATVGLHAHRNANLW